jgi:hypothetical protein
VDDLKRIYELLHTVVTNSMTNVSLHLGSLLFYYDSTCCRNQNNFWSSICIQSITLCLIHQLLSTTPIPNRYTLQTYPIASILHPLSQFILQIPLANYISYLKTVQSIRSQPNFTELNPELCDGCPKTEKKFKYL